MNKLRKILIYFSLLLLQYGKVAGFDPVLYDPESPISSRNCVLTVDKVNNVEWLLGKISEASKYVKEHPENRLAHKVRAYLVQFLYESVKGVSNKIKVGDLGIRYAAESLKILGDDINMKFWLAIFVAEKYIFLGPNLLKNIPFILASLKEVIEKNPRCCIGAPLFLIGRFYYRLPPFPVSYGDINLSEKYLRRAVEVNPNLIISHLYLAETLYAQGKIKEALEVLKNAEKIKPYCWMELILWKKYKAGIPILKMEFLNGTWNKEKDIYKLIQLKTP